MAWIDIFPTLAMAWVFSPLFSHCMERSSPWKRQTISSRISLQYLYFFEDIFSYLPQHRMREPSTLFKKFSLHFPQLNSSKSSFLNDFTRDFVLYPLQSVKNYELNLDIIYTQNMETLNYDSKGKEWENANISVNLVHISRET